LFKSIASVGIFDIEEVLTFLMTTISSKGEDERALIRRGAVGLSDVETS